MARKSGGRKGVGKGGGAVLDEPRRARGGEEPRQLRRGGHREVEQSAAYSIDSHPSVEAFVKNAGLGFAIPYHHNGQPHDDVPDFIVRLAAEPPRHLILETKGYDELEEVKRHAAERWVAALNAEGSFGLWSYAMAKKPADVRTILDRAS